VWCLNLFSGYFILVSWTVQKLLLFYFVLVQITRISGAMVATRGRYLPEDELTRAEPGYIADILAQL